MSSLLVQGILFDLDGVLIDSTAGVARVWRDWAIRHGLDPASNRLRTERQEMVEALRRLDPPGCAGYGSAGR